MKKFSSPSRTLQQQQKQSERQLQQKQQQKQQQKHSSSSPPPPPVNFSDSHANRPPSCSFSSSSSTSSTASYASAVSAVNNSNNKTNNNNINNINNNSNNLLNQKIHQTPPPINGEGRSGMATMTGQPGTSTLLLSGPLSDQDLDGGKLLSVEEREEIDPEDGCKIQVWTYHILSADGMEESTITKRRKLKVNCMQSLKRVEYTNGKETKFEERAIINNLGSMSNRANDSGDPPEGFSSFHQRLSNTANCQMDGARNEQDEEDSERINSMLLQTQDSFLRLVREKKEALIKLFPDLFTNLRTMPAIFEAMPSTVMETVVNEDGSTTTRTKCSKAFSSHYTRQETYINGVRKECRSRFRAFMEYAGPEGGFCIRLNDNADADLSEEEGNEQDVVGAAADERSLASSSGRSALSELGESQSALVVAGKQGQLYLLDKSAAAATKQAARRWEKAWHAVNEMVQSEERYVQKLALLERLRSAVEHAQLLDRRQQSQLFSNIASLHQFHEQHLLPQLMDRRREWQGTKRISDVLRKQAPFLKMYSEYTNNYKMATQMFEECMRKKRAFEELVRQFEQLPECEHLSLVSHLICPVQRVMRYQLLLKEYQKNLQPNDADWEDTETALILVLQAASHANEMMRKLDRYRNVLEIQEQLGNSIALVSPGRELLARSKLSKCSSSTGKVEERLLFVFNDMFLLASERSSLIGGIGASKFKLRAIFDARHTQICEGDNLELENSFYLRGADSAQGPQRCVELFCGTEAEKKALFDTVWAVILEVHSQEASNNGCWFTKAPTPGDQAKRSACCARCASEFGWYARQIVCRRCGQRYCKRCMAQKEQNKLCLNCLRTSEGIRSTNSEGRPTEVTSSRGGVVDVAARKNLLQVHARAEEPSIVKAGNLKFRAPSGKQLQRYFVLRNNFCVYSYRSEADQCALAMLPLSGCDVGVHVSAQHSEKFGISLRHMHRQYILVCDNESDHAEWLAALLLSANAKLPGESAQQEEREKRSRRQEESGDEQQQPPHPPSSQNGQKHNERFMKKSATVGFSIGRKSSGRRHQMMNGISNDKQQEKEKASSQSIQKPKSSLASTLKTPWSNLIRRSASMGEEQLGQKEMAAAASRLKTADQTEENRRRRPMEADNSPPNGVEQQQKQHKLYPSPQLETRAFVGGGESCKVDNYEEKREKEETKWTTLRF